MRFLLQADLRRERALEVANDGARVHRSVRNLETLAAVLRRVGDTSGALTVLEAAIALDKERGGLEAERLTKLHERAREGSNANESTEAA